ncbi:hypothetical protein [Nocardioides massiliensis]|uniref:Uncharacterized protein n=1 Tax=Nocardioides massiliensis TaxID=1325935 RepID=A0ABT9NMH2_9ACTN|nr:hypothetical protein [Nocardioides massiliensis]MDP9821620.1 hypothetical protein [Nocardioides massiliensis]
MKRIVTAYGLFSKGAHPPPRARNYDGVAEAVAKTVGKISAKRLLSAARAADYEGSDRNFRRLVATAKRERRLGQVRAGGRGGGVAW